MIFLYIGGITVLVFIIIEIIDNILKSRARKNEILQKGSVFCSSYNIHKHVNKIKNISLYEFDKVLLYVNSIAEIKLHISTVNNVMIDFIIEVIDPNAKYIAKRLGYPHTTSSLDRIQLAEYYVKCHNKSEYIDKINNSKFFMMQAMSSLINSGANNPAIFLLFELLKMHHKELKEQMVDENDFRYWFKSTFVY